MNKEISKDKTTDEGEKFEFSGVEASDEIKRKVKENFEKLINELKSREAIPTGGNIHINYDTENGKIKSYFIENKNKEIIKFADLRKNDLFLKTLKEYFRGSYIGETGKYLTDSEIEQYIDELADMYLEEEIEFGDKVEN